MTESVLLPASDTMIFQLLQVTHCDCVRPDGPCGCNPPHDVRNVQLQELGQTSVGCAKGEMPCNESPHSKPAQCLCLDDGKLKLCECNASGGGKGKAQSQAQAKRDGVERGLLHCMCLIDEPDGTVKPCDCNKSTDFLATVHPLEDGVAIRG